MMKYIYLLLIGSLSILGLLFSSPTPSPTLASTAVPPPIYSYEVINKYPHDPDAFTQGLVYQDGIFYEGTGLRGRSSLRKVEVETGDVQQKIDLGSKYFGEGITIWEDRVIQLTWQSQIGFVYNKDSFEQLSQFNYPTEGWGITHDGEKLIMSDGSATLYFWDPDTLTEIGRIQVYDDQGPVVQLNELEYIKGDIYANIWQTNKIAQINLSTGQVLAYLDMTGLLELPLDYNKPVDVLNGIAYDTETDRLFITGKLWPYLYEVKLISPTPNPSPTPDSSPDLSRGLVAYYPFYGNAEDNTAQVNHATVHGATLTTDRFGRSHQAYQFDGETDYLEINHTPNHNTEQELTLTLWYYHQLQTDSAQYPLLVKTAFGDSPARYGLWVQNDRLLFCLQSEIEPTPACLTNNQPFSTEQWYHIVATYDNNTMRLYINNQQTTQQTTPAITIATSNSPILIGREVEHYLYGRLDEIRLYNRALSEAEVDQLYQQRWVYLPIIMK